MSVTFLTNEDKTELEQKIEESKSSGGATAEQLAQIEQNKNDISRLSEEIEDLQVGNSGCNCTLKDGDYNVLAINHRGYCTVAPENTIPAYILSKEKGYNYVECDISFTKDGVAVLLHNSTIDATSNGTGSISELTYAEVLQYDFGSWKSSAYAGTKIPTFKEFITLCKNIGLHPYIELKSSGAYAEEQIASIVDIVKSVGMEGKVTYISFNINYLSYVKNADRKARLGFLVYGADMDVINQVISLRTGNNEVFLDQSYTNVTETSIALCIENNVPLEIWTVNSTSVIENMNEYITGVTSDNLIAGKVLRDKHMTYTPPSTEDIILQSISATYNGGNVTAGTSVNSLTGIVVTGTYSNGITSTISGYTLSGEIVEGENTITVSYNGLTTTFKVTGITGESGGDEPVIPEEPDGTLLYNWNLKEALTDSIGSNTAILSGATKDDNGVYLTNASHYVEFPNVITKNRIIDVDVVSYNRQGGEHGRLIMFPWSTTLRNTGFIYRNTGNWDIYNQGTWAGSENISDTTYFNGNTVRFVIDSDGYIKVYRGGVLVSEHSQTIGLADSNIIYPMYIGSPDGNSAYNLQITAVRVYQGN